MAMEVMLVLWVATACGYLSSSSGSSSSNGGGNSCSRSSLYLRGFVFGYVFL